MTDLGEDELFSLRGNDDLPHLATGRILESEHSMSDGLENISELVSRLRFAIKDGRIWLDTQRVLLIHLSTMTSLRKELINNLGSDKAKGFMIRMGYTSGLRDAALAKKLRPHHTTRDTYLIGPQLRVLQGISRSKPSALEIDVKSGHFFSEFIVTESFEADAHISTFGMSSESTCWLQTGYLCGFSSAFMGKPIIHREVECRSTGGRYCRFIGKPANQWEYSGDIDSLHEILTDEFSKFGKYKKVTHLINASKNIMLPSKDSCACDHHTQKMVGTSAAYRATTHLITKVSKTNTTVLFLGETGVGKERFASLLHSMSKRSGKPFIAVNCAAIPENLIEAELFGVEKGAYTGADASRKGKFERADGGTLFLDEVGNLSKPAQIKLLRAIQEREFERIGGNSVIKCDVRIIAATNIDLNEAVKRDEFRSDLFYRLNVFPVNIPPLRERRDDIPLLMRFFLEKNACELEKELPGFTIEAVDLLYNYSYPGNIRELENMIERASILADDEKCIDLIHLCSSDDHTSYSPLKVDSITGALLSKKESTESNNKDASLLDTFISSECSLSDLEVGILDEAIKHSEGNIAQAARLLGLTRPQMAYRLKKSLQSSINSNVREPLNGDLKQ